MTDNTERDKLAQVIYNRVHGHGWQATMMTDFTECVEAADAILAEWAPAHDREKAVRAWNEGYAVGGAEMRMLLLDPPLKPIPNPYSRRES